MFRWARCCALLTVVAILSGVSCVSLGNTGLRARVTACQMTSWNTSHHACSGMPTWDTSQVTDMSYLFEGAPDVPLDISRWDTSSVTTMRAMLKDSSLNVDISRWDTSSVTDMSSMFQGARYFSNDLSLWDTSSATDLSYMFYKAELFDGNISPWNVSRVTTMSYMFGEAYSFTGNIAAWDVSSVTDMEGMFYSAWKFRGGIGLWDTSRVTTMEAMFYEAHSFDGTIGGWDVGNVENMAEMFSSCCYADGSGDYALQPFDTDFSAWNTGSVITMYAMFNNARYFNGSVAGWDTSSAQDMDYMFSQTNHFNDDLSRWDTRSVTTMYSMFCNAIFFNGDISMWNVGSVNDMSYMFEDAESFNQNLAAWDTSAVTGMGYMFQGAKKFNGDVSTWNTASVTAMTSMFKDADEFNSDISRWDTARVTCMFEMFRGASVFNVNLCDWDRSSVLRDSNAFTNNPKLSFCDVNECSEEICDGNSNCVNTDGSFNCTCNSGFVGDGLMCSDLDECDPPVEPTYPAATQWRVRNLGDCGWRPGVSELIMSDANGNRLTGEVISSGYTSYGPPQSAVDGRSQTKWRPDNHAPRAGQVWIGLRFSSPTEVRRVQAENLGMGRGGGRYWSGGVELQYSDDGETWTTAASQPNSNAATVSPTYPDTGSVCGSEAVCLNTPGSFTCSCATGFVMDGDECSDIDECESALACDSDAACTNTEGSFTCACNTGFVGDGLMCSDVDECDPTAFSETAFPSARHWRVRNLGDCGWRPRVWELVMSDADGNRLTGEVISSGYTSYGLQQWAVDGRSWTSWRPHIHAPRARQVWIGLRFSSPTEVREAQAENLGVGFDGGRAWNGGVELQYSDDGETWTTAASQPNSNAVRVTRQLPVWPTPHGCGEHQVCMNTVGSYTCTCEEGFVPSSDGSMECESMSETRRKSVLNSRRRLAQ